METVQRQVAVTWPPVQARRGEFGQAEADRGAQARQKLPIVGAVDQIRL